MKKILKVGSVLFAAALLSFSAEFSFAAGNAQQPSICSRSCWGARSAGLNTNMSALNRAIVHHTAGPGDYTTDYNTAKSRVRGVQNYHMDVNGWSDIGYHFLFSAGGHSFEGRRDSLNKSVQRRGAHDGNNTNSFGFSNLGYYHSPYNHTLTNAQKHMMYDVIAWRMPNGWSPYGAGSYNGNTVGYVDGHRDVKSTSCPGDTIYNTIIGTNHNSGEIRAEIWARIQGSSGNLAPGPDAVSYQDGRIDVFGRGGGNKVYQKYFNGSWHGWVNQGGYSTGGIGVCSMEPGRLDVFIRGSNNALHQRYYNNGTWSSWIDKGGTLPSGPDAVSWGNNRIDVVARGGGNAVFHKWFNGSGWSGWESLAGSIQGDPAVCSWAPGRLDVFAIGGGGALYHKWYDNGTWYPYGRTGGWQNLGGSNLSGVDAVSWGQGRIDVVSVDSSGDVVHKWYSNGWSGWENLGGNATSDPTICAQEPGRLDIFVRGSNNAMKQRYYTGGGASGWSAWVDLGGVFQ